MALIGKESHGSNRLIQVCVGKSAVKMVLFVCVLCLLTTCLAFCIHVSWQKTKIQNLGAGEYPPCLLVCGHSQEEVTEFTYSGICSIYYGQVSTRHCQAHWHRFYCHAFYEKSLATDPASTTDKTLLVPDLYTIHFVVRFGDMDTSAGRSTEARGLPHAFPAYDPRDMLA